MHSGALGLGESWSVTLDKLLHLLVPQFLHLYNGINRTHLMGFQLSFDDNDHL